MNLTISASVHSQVTRSLCTECLPVISYNGFNGCRELIGSKSQKSGEPVHWGLGWWWWRWGRWWWCVLVCQELGHHIHQLGLCGHHLLHLVIVVVVVVVVVVGVTARRHLLGFSIDEHRKKDLKEIFLPIQTINNNQQQANDHTVKQVKNFINSKKSKNTLKNKSSSDTIL